MPVRPTNGWMLGSRELIQIVLVVGAVMGAYVSLTAQIALLSSNVALVGQRVDAQGARIQGQDLILTKLDARQIALERILERLMERDRLEKRRVIDEEDAE